MTAQLRSRCGGTSRGAEVTIIRVLIRFMTAGLTAGLVVVGTASAQAGGSAQWRVAYQPRVEGVVSSVAATGPHDAWAVGQLYRGEAPINQPFVIHWAGQGWHAVRIPGASGFSSQDVQASSPRNAWVFGWDTRGAIALPAAFRWDGTAWHAVSLPESFGIGTELMISATDIWGVGQINCTPAACVSRLWHWNGSTWRSRSVGTFVTGLASAGSNDVWAAGLNGMASVNEGSIVAYHWNGRRWLWVRMPHPHVNGFPGIGMSSAADVWLGSFIIRKGQYLGLALHWNGRQWRQLTAPAFLDAIGPVLPDGHGGAWLGSQAHWTGRSWVDVSAALPPGVSSFDVGPLTRIPGTSSYWAAGSLNVSFPSVRPAIWVYGPVPR